MTQLRQVRQSDASDNAAGYTELRPGIGPTQNSFHLAFDAGRLAWMRGAVKPPEPPEDANSTPEQAYWLGYMYERGIKILAGILAERRREAIRDYIEFGHDLPPEVQP